ncbi:hypothetical protein O3Q51_17220 [Cryomorphaceae bacterium 1068]|nr:hypothetical protein [Cryomorphaceae bacterium 1068]
MDFTLNFTDAGTPFCLIAALLFAKNYEQLSKVEKPIAIVIWLNLICDIVCFFLSEYEVETGLAYNFLLPIERVISLFVYFTAVSQKSRIRWLFLFGMVSVVLIRIGSTILENPPTELQYAANTLEGLMTAILSYVFIRTIIAEKARVSLILLAFGLANFFYLTLMATAMSALPLAGSIDKAYANALYSINTVAYIFWSIILITAILWKKRI